MRLVVEPYCACVASSFASATHRSPSSFTILAKLRIPSRRKDAEKTEVMVEITCTIIVVVESSFNSSLHNFNDRTKEVNPQLRFQNFLWIHVRCYNGGG